MYSSRRLRRDVPARPPDHDGDLALVVQVPAVGRPDHRAAVADQRGDRLVEVRRRGGQRGAELGDPAAVVEVHRDDLGRHHGRQVHRVRGRHPPAVRGDQVVPVADDLDAGAVEQDPAVLGHRGPAPSVHPAAGRSNHRCTCPVPTEFS